MLKRYLSILSILGLALTANGQTAKISGFIHLFSGEAMPNTSVILLNKDNIQIAQTTTDTDGAYEFINLATNNIYKVKPERAVQTIQEVSIIDILVLIKHILFIHPFTSPYQYIAGDVNSTDGNTTLDVVLIQKAILGIGDSLPWRFIRSVEEFTDPTNPFLDISPTDNEIQLTEDVIGVNFTGIKAGDTDLSFDPNNL